jgi:hypothetical protein
LLSRTVVVNWVQEVTDMRPFLLALALALAAPASPQPAGRPSVTPSPMPAETLFSRRALRQARLILQMRLLQLHGERLECVKSAIIQRLPPDVRPRP